MLYDLRQQLIDKCDQTDIIDILNISVEEVVDVFWNKITDNLPLFEDVVDTVEEEGEGEDDY
jgi:hypothetical protein|tara:strand:- start:1942 stop:2127 length:186 start_codon:yes stop_codon:yes gene_type:complete